MTNQKKSPPNLKPEQSKLRSFEEEVLPLPAPTETLALIRLFRPCARRLCCTFVSCPDVTIRSDVIEQMYEQLRPLGKLNA